MKEETKPSKTADYIFYAFNGLMGAGFISAVIYLIVSLLA